MKIQTAMKKVSFHFTKILNSQGTKIPILKHFKTILYPTKMYSSDEFFILGNKKGLKYQPGKVQHNHDMPMHLLLSQDEKIGKVGPMLLTYRKKEKHKSERNNWRQIVLPTCEVPNKEQLSTCNQLFFIIFQVVCLSWKHVQLYWQASV